MSSTQERPTYISKIHVEKLFGQFDHHLEFQSQSKNAPNLMILYGENGTGKTTLLWMLYHLLNKENGRGHRSYLVKQQFRSFSVEFNEGTKLSAERDKGDIGSFTLSVAKKGRQIASFRYEMDREGDVPNLKSNDKHTVFSTFLPNFQFGFLPHDRMRTLEAEGSTKTTTKDSDPDKSSLSFSVSRALAVAREHAIKSSNEGQFTVNAIYTSLLERIATAPRSRSSSVAAKRKSLLERIHSQSILMKEFSEFGLIPFFKGKDLEAAIEKLPGPRLVIAEQVLEPWLRGNEARLEALNPLRIAFKTFVDTLNSLYLYKKVSIHLQSGLEIVAQNDHRLAPDVLSSGEKQLLILFCEVIAALKPDTILFIDEPELSLNVTWQEGLINALLQCASGSNVQFVIATHSIELLTRHRDNVVRLSTEIVGSATEPVREGGARG